MTRNRKNAPAVAVDAAAVAVPSPGLPKSFTLGIGLVIGLVIGTGSGSCASTVALPDCVPLTFAENKLILPVSFISEKHKLKVTDLFQLDTGSSYSHISFKSVGNKKIFREEWIGTLATAGPHGPVKEVYPLVQMDSVTVGTITMSPGFVIVSGQTLFGLSELTRHGYITNLANLTICCSPNSSPVKRILPQVKGPWLSWSEMQPILQRKSNELNKLLDTGVSNAVVGVVPEVTMSCQATVDSNISHSSSLCSNIQKSAANVVGVLDLGVAPAGLGWYDNKKHSAGVTIGIDLGVAPASVSWNMK